ncbi:hypothetical protein P7C70_g7648, partial [Phenoliferia sp. Uapishka_3]
MPPRHIPASRVAASLAGTHPTLAVSGEAELLEASYSERKTWRRTLNQSATPSSEQLSVPQTPPADKYPVSALPSHFNLVAYVNSSLGLGGGVSSLSKACIIGPPGEGVSDQALSGLLPGPSWADESKHTDIIYRFCQVGIRDQTMDWTASCGNMLSAVALASISTPLIPYSTLFTRARSLPQPKMGEPLLFPLTILSASNGKVMRARVPVDPMSLQVWEPGEGEGCRIAGVPGEEVGIEVEMPIEMGEDG